MNQPPYAIYTDGGARGNPGPAAYGFVIRDPAGRLVAKEAQYIGVTTNNQAEYQGIVAALAAVSRERITAPLVCYLDSELVVRQINGQYRTKNLALKGWLEQIELLVANHQAEVQFHHVKRAENRFADRLVNGVLDRQSSHEATP